MSAPPTPPGSTPSPKTHHLHLTLPRDAAPNAAGDPERPAKKQRKAASPSDPPLTPPHSQSCSPATSGTPPPLPTRSPTPPPSPPTRHRDQKACFDALSVDVQRRILLHALDTMFPKINIEGNHAVELTDARLLNQSLYQCLLRRSVLQKWCAISKTWRSILQPLLYYPAVVTSYEELCTLAGSSYELYETQEKEKGPMDTRKRDYNAYMNGRTRNPDHQVINDPAPAYVRRKSKKAKHIEEMVLWMALKPKEDSTCHEPRRWPQWYLTEYMRHELEELGVKKLTIISPGSSILAHALQSLVPIHENLTHLRLEVFFSIGLLYPTDDRFFRAHWHHRDLDHLCPRLTLLKDSLVELSLRNIPVCEHLFTPAWPRLQKIDVSFVNANPGLCHSMIANDYSYCMDVWNRDTDAVVIGLRDSLFTFTKRHRCTEISVVVTSDDFHQFINKPGTYQHMITQKPLFWTGPLYGSEIGSYAWAQEATWMQLKYGCVLPRQAEEEVEDDEDLASEYSYEEELGWDDEADPTTATAAGEPQTDEEFAKSLARKDEAEAEKAASNGQRQLRIRM